MELNGNFVIDKLDSLNLIKGSLIISILNDEKY
jgi:hypothetical protein